jgi:hypothetical protein
LKEKTIMTTYTDHLKLFTLPIVRAQVEIGDDYQERATVDGVHYYVVEPVPGDRLALVREIWGVDYGGNVHRRKVAPESVYGVEADYPGLPIRGSHSEPVFWLSA